MICFILGAVFGAVVGVTALALARMGSGNS